MLSVLVERAEAAGSAHLPPGIPPIPGIGSQTAFLQGTEELAFPRSTLADPQLSPSPHPLFYSGDPSVLGSGLQHPLPAHPLAWQGSGKGRKTPQ